MTQKNLTDLVNTFKSDCNKGDIANAFRTINQIDDESYNLRPEGREYLDAFHECEDILQPKVLEILKEDRSGSKIIDAYDCVNGPNNNFANTGVLYVKPETWKEIELAPVVNYIKDKGQDWIDMLQIIADEQCLKENQLIALYDSLVNDKVIEDTNRMQGIFMDFSTDAGLESDYNYFCDKLEKYNKKLFKPEEVVEKEKYPRSKNYATWEKIFEKSCSIPEQFEKVVKAGKVRDLTPAQAVLDYGKALSTLSTECVDFLKYANQKLDSKGIERAIKDLNKSIAAEEIVQYKEDIQ